ncbi:MAG: hypothetical protein ACTHOU_21935 [Aureliella sp.]
MKTLFNALMLIAALLVTCAPYDPALAGSPAADQKKSTPQTQSNDTVAGGSKTAAARAKGKEAGEMANKSRKKLAENDPTSQAAELTKQIDAIKRSLLRSFAAAKLSDEQKEQADALFAKVGKSFVSKRAAAQITEELQKKYASSLKAADGKSAKERAASAYEMAGFSPEQIKVYESTQKALEKAKRDFAVGLSDKQIAALPKTLQKSIQAK